MFSGLYLRSQLWKAGMYDEGLQKIIFLSQACKLLRTMFFTSQSLSASLWSATSFLPLWTTATQEQVWNVTLCFEDYAQNKQSQSLASGINHTSTDRTHFYKRDHRQTSFPYVGWGVTSSQKKLTRGEGGVLWRISSTAKASLPHYHNVHQILFSLNTKYDATGWDGLWALMLPPF